MDSHDSQVVSPEDISMQQRGGQEESVEESISDIRQKLSRIEANQMELSKALAKKKGFSLTFEEEENPERGNWSGKFDFFLSCLGYAVGLGNVWRFPYLCYKNGGGAFFIPYCIFLFFCGMPIFCLELSLGQFCSSGPLSCWEFAPLFRGVGVGMVIVSGLVGIYYNIIIAWSFWYLFTSFTSKLPWSECGSWSTELCRERLTPVNSTCNNDLNLRIDNGTGINGTCWLDTNGTRTLYGIYDAEAATAAGYSARPASNEYLNYVGLQDRLGSIGNMGPLRWDMSLCLLLGWIVVFASLSKGIKSSGKVVYFTAIFPYVVLIILLIRGLTLPGYEKGIDFYLKPDLSRLQDSTVWKDAAVQIFFSLSASWGGLITLASYNRFKTDTVRDAMLVSICNCATSVFAGFVVFSFLGYLATLLNTEVTNVVDSGVALAFIVYPQAVTSLPVSPLWAILFFVMLITLGLDSQFTLIETVVTAVQDKWPRTRRYKTLLILGISVVFFFIGLSMCTPGGPQLLTIFDDYSGGWNIMVIAILECVSICYVYGVKRFCDDIEAMTGPIVAGCIPWFIFKWWWIICWCAFTPGLVAVTMVFSWVKFSPSSYGGNVLPDWAQVIGWLLTFSVLASIVVVSGIAVWQSRGNLRALVQPTRYWGPALVKFRQEVADAGYAPGFVVDPWTEDNIEDPSNPHHKYDEDKGYQIRSSSMTKPQRCDRIAMSSFNKLDLL
ncbi:hypothetical protein BOX15_Mlig024827g2 [Macrostomum lignano]|uniref:Transporter n=1 Tax=Macrostomum lignano TaxID=282301 RepID=A0A267DEM2_9PLAT|nr:hypothetical protein BOX15_Mlig024827g2 [Macrostomum lignano]